jgi:hypothetical protein
VAVHFGEQQEPLYNAKGQIKFHSLLSFRGHCYVTTLHGHVMRVDLRGPRMVYLSREMAVSSQTGSALSGPKTTGCSWYASCPVLTLHMIAIHQQNYSRHGMVLAPAWRSSRWTLLHWEAAEPTERHCQICSIRWSDLFCHASY